MVPSDKHSIVSVLGGDGRVHYERVLLIHGVLFNELGQALQAAHTSGETAMFVPLNLSFDEIFGQ